MKIFIVEDADPQLVALMLARKVAGDAVPEFGTNFVEAARKVLSTVKQ